MRRREARKESAQKTKTTCHGGERVQERDGTGQEDTQRTETRRRDSPHLPVGDDVEREIADSVLSTDDPPIRPDSASDLPVAVIKLKSVVVRHTPVG
eukprot:1903135-Rhodomonas_salina.1